jgi:hypothetical protein
METTRQVNSTAAKWITVGVMNPVIAPRRSSLKIAVPIETATNIKPTSVADAVPTRA